MSSKNILIIDDDEELCEELQEFLSGRGHQVVHTQDSVYGQTMVRKNKFDVLIIDYKMPGLTGLEVIENLDPKNPLMKVFLISGRPFIEQMAQQVSGSVRIDKVLSKPINLDDLLTSIESNPL